MVRVLLVVEDDSGDAVLVQRGLTSPSCQVSVVGTCAGAVAYLRRHPHCRAVLTDLGLPDTSGLSVITALQDAAPDLVIVAYSSSVGDSDMSDDYVRQAGELGVLLLPKPAAALSEWASMVRAVLVGEEARRSAVSSRVSSELSEVLALLKADPVGEPPPSSSSAMPAAPPTAQWLDPSAVPRWVPWALLGAASGAVLMVLVLALHLAGVDMSWIPALVTDHE